MAEKSLQEILIDDLMGNSSKSPRENAAVAEILRLRQLLGTEHKPIINDNPIAVAGGISQKHGKAGKGSTAKAAEKSESVNE